MLFSFLQFCYLVQHSCKTRREGHCALLFFFAPSCFFQYCILLQLSFRPKDICTFLNWLKLKVHFPPAKSLIVQVLVNQVVNCPYNMPVKALFIFTWCRLKKQMEEQVKTNEAAILKAIQTKSRKQIENAQQVSSSLWIIIIFYFW